MIYEGRNFVGGVWLESDTVPYVDTHNPATGEITGSIPCSSQAEVTHAIAAAFAASRNWRSVSRVQRADYFDKLAQLLKRDHDQLVATIVLETGKNPNEAHAEVIEALHMCQVAFGSGRTPYGEVIASELSTKDAQVFRKPKGVVAVIAPWNFPLAIGSFWASAPALVEGNTVVHKPSELTPMIAEQVAKLYEEAGFPPGVYNLIHGDGRTGQHLVEGDVDCILFTGSAEVGKSIRQHCASTWHKTCSCELGSKSAVITFEDGNLDLALDVSIASAFKLSGQRCVSSGRMLIERPIYDRFCEAFAARAGELKTGDMRSEQGCFYGPLISPEAVAKVEFYNQLVRQDARRNHDVEILLNGGPVDRQGNFMTPFVYACQWGDKKYLKEEVFGPHVALIPFEDVDQAIDIYNDTPYGLALGVVTDDFRKMRRCQRECNTGMLYLNGGSIAAESHLPFGGIGKSGNGYKSAAGTYRAVTEEIAVTTNYEEGKVTWAQGMK